MICGINHITLAVVALPPALAFYRDVLGFTVAAEWPEGAYLEAGRLWLCLSVDSAARHGRPHPDYTHIAFDVAETHFTALAQRIAAVAPLWRENKSEGASLYFLDPDGHKLELHVGNLSSRLQHYRDTRPAGMQINKPD